MVAIGAVLLATGGWAFSSEIEVTSEISQVTVYANAALVTRRAEINLPAGEHTLIFAGLLSPLDANSIKVSVGEDETVKIFGAQLKKTFLEDIPSQEIRKLKDEIQNIQDEIKKRDDLKKILADEKDFLDSLRLFSRDKLPEDLVTRVPSAKELEDTLNFLDSKLKENFSRAMEADRNIRDLRKKLEAALKKLAQMQGNLRKELRSIEVDVKAMKAKKTSVSVSYLVPAGAFWRPLYDARACFEKSEVELVSYAIVRQTTGEDWNNVALAVSTAKPAIGGRMPYISPWFLRVYESRRAELYDKAQLKAGVPMRSQFRAFKEKVGLDEEMEAGVALEPEVEEKGVAVLYTLPRPVSIPADGSEHKLPISTQILKARFKYSTYPRLSMYSYLGSRVTNAEKLQLLSGKMNVFLEGDFVGQSSIDNIGPGEEFDLYLGVDENVKVKREQIEKKVDDVLIAGIPAPNRRIFFKYKLRVENYKSKDIMVNLFEAMPVSQDERIRVRLTGVDVQPAEKDWEDRRGIWKWELHLKPQEKRDISYTFSIEHPRRLNIEGL
jgi:uncharacterized protein (TIGR02231 family)